MTCDGYGNFPNLADWPECMAPASCGAAPTPPAEETTLTLKDTAQADGIKAYRYANNNRLMLINYILQHLYSRHLMYSCPTAEETTDFGPEFKVLCRADGTYEPLSEWPECRAKVSCTATPPDPTLESGLANTTSDDPAKEGESVVYHCADDTFKLPDKYGKLAPFITIIFNNKSKCFVGGSDGFTLTCGKDGTFGEVTFPTCYDPHAVFGQDDEEECFCIGDDSVDKDLAKKLRDDFCRSDKSFRVVVAMC